MQYVWRDMLSCHLSNRLEIHVKLQKMSCVLLLSWSLVSDRIEFDWSNAKIDLWWLAIIISTEVSEIHVNNKIKCAYLKQRKWISDWFCQKRICFRLKDARGQVAVKEKSCKESQKAYAKEQSTLKNLQKELATIEVRLVC